MKIFLSLIVWLLSVSISYAYTPSEAMQGFLEQKITSYEVIIDMQWESMRDKFITAMEKILGQAPAKNYRDIDQDKFIYIISYLSDALKKNRSTTLTLADFPNSYDGFEIVQYPSQIVATVRNTGPFGQTNDDSFQNLAGFIFGDNSSGTEIAMTSPVTRTQLDEYTYESAFIMPDGWTLSSLPTPNNDRISIKTIPWSLKAVKRFSGRVTKDVVDTQRAVFQEELTSQWITRYGLPTLSQYDWPRVSAGSRRNELWVELQEVKFEF